MYLYKLTCDMSLLFFFKEDFSKGGMNLIKAYIILSLSFLISFCIYVFYYNRVKKQ